MRLLAALFLAASATFARSELLGTITLGNDTVGVWKDYGDVQMNGGTVTLNGNCRAYLVKPGIQALGPDAYYELPLWNNHFSYNVDLSRVDCGCNAAAYFNSMPANQPTGGNNWYCDANYVGGVGCPEYDTLESNKHIIASTLHKCQWDGNWWTGCDGGGCQATTWDALGPDGFGPGKSGGINTDQPFLISHYQREGQSNVWMQQGGIEKSYEVCYGNTQYLQAMEGPWKKGMVFVMSLWQGDMSWLDGRTGCQEQCNLASNRAVFSNFALH